MMDLEAWPKVAIIVLGWSGWRESEYSVETASFLAVRSKDRGFC